MLELSQTDANGTVYFVNHSKRLYALDVESKGMVDSSWPTFQGDNQNSGRFYVHERDEAIPDRRYYTSRPGGSRSEKMVLRSL